MSTSQRKGSTNGNETNAMLKTRVRELEEEVANLKQRLDELRKAKSTTITKREREVLNVGTPFGKRDPKTEVKTTELNKKLSDTQRNHEKELQELRQTFAAEMEELEKRLRKELKCDHENEIKALKKRVSELEADNSALLIENSDLKERVSSLVSELSIKEAKWCQTEEEMKLQMQRQWGDKYREWMAKTEAKIQELQETNDLLRGYLKKKDPDSFDPSGRRPPPSEEK